MVWSVPILGDVLWKTMRYGGDAWRKLEKERGHIFACYFSFKRRVYISRYEDVKMILAQELELMEGGPRGKAFFRLFMNDNLIQTLYIIHLYILPS